MRCSLPTLRTPSRASRDDHAAERLCSTERVGKIALRLRSSGMKPMPASIAERGERMRTGSECTLISPSAGMTPASASASSLLPQPTSPATPTISPARTSKLASCTVSSCVVRPRDREHRGALLDDALAEEIADLAPDHHAHELALGRRGQRLGADQVAVAQHRHARAALVHLAQAVRDEHDRDAARAQELEALQQALRGGLRERARGLVEHDHARVGRDRARHLDLLLHLDRERPDARAGVDVDAEVGERLGGPAMRRGPVDRAVAARQAAHQDVLRDRQRRRQRQLLADRDDAALDRVARAGEGDRLAVDLDRAGVGLRARRRGSS